MHKTVWRGNIDSLTTHHAARGLQALPPGQRHFRKKGHRVVALTPHHRPLHRHPAFSRWRCTDPAFAPDFAMLLLAAAALIALIYLFSLASGIPLIHQDQLPGHPTVLVSPLLH